LSKNPSREEIEEFENSLVNGSLMLDGAPKDDKITFASFFRCGNTLTRKYFEAVTGISTGSIMLNDSIPNFTLF
jgi:hypothetical protein